MGIIFGSGWQPGVLSPVEQAILDEILSTDDERGPAYRRAWAAYHGDLSDPDVPGAGLGDAAEGEFPIRVNKCAGIVDTATGLLFAPPPAYNLPPAPADAPDAPPPAAAPDAEPDADSAPETQTPTEIRLDAILRANAWPALLLDLRANGGICGTPYVKFLSPAPPEYPYPRVQVLDSRCMTIRWDPRDISRVTAYIWQTTAPDPQSGKLLYVRQVTARLPSGRWSIVDQHAPVIAGLDPRAQDWQTDGPAVAWPYPWAPILHCKNLPAPNAVYGTPDLTPEIIRLNAAYNRHLTNDADVQWGQGHPILYGTGIGTAPLNADRRYFNHLPAGAVLGQLAPTLDHESARILRKEIRDDLHATSRTPAITQGMGDLTNPSGIAIQLQFWPVLRKVDILWTCYEPLLTETIRRLCELDGLGADRIPTWTRKTVLPADVFAHAQALQIEAGLGTVSKATLATDFGRDWATEQSNLAEEAAAAPPPPPVLMMPPGRALIPPPAGPAPDATEPPEAPP